MYLKSTDFKKILWNKGLEAIYYLCVFQISATVSKLINRFKFIFFHGCLKNVLKNQKTQSV